ncbi:MAG: type I restriction enzyme HsdR N-terminal domain-containing protein [Crocinitomicaceae bacterium]
MHPLLNFPTINVKIKDNKIWDILRLKYVNNTPEEWVRQHIIHFLVEEKGYSKNLMQSEQTVVYNGLKKRCDIVIYNSALVPMAIIECKAPRIRLTEDTFFQIAKYYSTLQAPLLILTNGISHIYALMDPSSSKIEYLKDLPTQKKLEELTHNL